MRPDSKLVLKFIQNNPGCSRRLIYDNFSQEKSGHGRRGVVKSIVKRIDYLIRIGKIDEKDIERVDGPNGKGNIRHSKLFVHEERSPQSERSRQDPISQIGATGDLKEKEKIILSVFAKAGEPLSFKDVGQRTRLSPSTLYRILSQLEHSLLISKVDASRWWLTTKGTYDAKKSIPYRDLYSAAPTDNFFYHIPMLIGHSGETFTPDNIAQRAYGYLGFYEKFGMEERHAKDDFREKIRNHLESEVLKNSFIHADLFEYKVTNDEDQLYLWRLYSMLHTILFKSSKEKRLGMAVWLYEPLLKLLKGKWETLEQKIAPLPPEDRFIIKLMLNGVQLETIVPKIKTEDFRAKLKLCGMPFTVYNSGTDNETTVIESTNRNEEAE